MPRRSTSSRFFGFADKTAEQKAEDEKFVSAMIGATGSARKGFRGNNQARLDRDTGRQGARGRGSVQSSLSRFT
jgi:hypothetical protein